MVVATFVLGEQSRGLYNLVLSLKNCVLKLAGLESSLIAHVN